MSSGQLIHELPLGRETPSFLKDVLYSGSHLWLTPGIIRKKKSLLCMIMGFPCGSADKECTCNVGDLGSIPGLGRSPGEEKGYPLQYSGLEIPCIVHEVTKGQTRLRDFHFHCIIREEDQRKAWHWLAGNLASRDGCDLDRAGVRRPLGKEICLMGCSKRKAVAILHFSFSEPHKSSVKYLRSEKCGL